LALREMRLVCLNSFGRNRVWTELPAVPERTWILRRIRQRIAIYVQRRL